MYIYIYIWQYGGTVRTATRPWACMSIATREQCVCFNRDEIIVFSCWRPPGTPRRSAVRHQTLCL